MKFMICGSMQFARQMLDAQKALQGMGHVAHVSPDTHDCLENPDLNMDLEHCIRLDIDKACFDMIADSDAILVLNYPKNNMEGYIGGATLMEIGLARHLNKKIFILNKLPSEEELRYALEVKLTKPVILDGDISNISRHLDSN